LRACSDLERYADGVWLKREDEHELGSFKWRGALAVLEAQRPDAVVTASTGNHGAATAWAAGRLGIPATVFVPDAASSAKTALIEAQGAELRRAGADFDEAKAVARAFAAERGFFYFEDGAEPAQFAGYEAIGDEILDALPDAAAVVVPVGNGALAIGVFRAFERRGAAAVRVAVSAENAPVMHDSWHEGAVVDGRRSDTVADGLAVRVAIPLAVAELQPLAQRFELVSELELAFGVSAYAKRGLRVEASAAAALALALREDLPRPTVLVVTGRNIDELLHRRLCATARYVARNPESQRLHERRARVMPGGNTRTTIHVAPYPVTIVRGEGARIVDADGHEYVDFLGEYTAGLFGHSHPAIVAAVREALADGIVLGAPNRYEALLAEALCERFPSVDLVRFCNSGTEANLLALSLACAVTGRSGVLRFTGAYHGGIVAPYDWTTATYNDADGATRLIEAKAAELAAVIVEPLQGAGGVIPGDQEFLRALREATAAAGVLLVFDEVMTSRLSLGGMQRILGITPDLTTVAKYIGGGLAFGALGGRAELMARFDPSRPDAIPHGGTFNDDVLTMAAGAAAATVLTEHDIDRINALGDRLRDRLNALDHEFCATGYGSLVGLHFTRGPVRSAADVPEAAELRTLLHLYMLEHGYSYGRRGFIALSLPLGENDVAGFASAVEEFLTTL
jgi:glutamate-1-semialdehyde 2,1-aminomutase